MAGELAAVDLKIGRAKRKLADLDETIKGVFAPDCYRIVGKFDPESAKYVYRVYDLPPVDPEWALELGEVLYQLRSALDHLTWQLVKLDGGTPNEQTQFPVKPSPNDKHGKLIPLRNLVIPRIKRADILKLIDECQPYESGLGERLPVAEAKTTPIWHLNVLNIVDKHRLLLVVASALDFDSMYWGLGDDDPIPTFKLNTKPLKEGDPVAWFDFGGAEAPSHFDAHPAIRVTLRDPEAPALWYNPLVGVIENLCWWVEWEIVNLRFRPLFP
jgi:hypothetical protein